MKVCGWMEVWLHTFIAYVLDESGWLDSGFSRFIPLLRASDIQWIGDWLGSRKSPGRFAEDKNVLIVPWSEPRIVHPVVCYLYRLRYLGSNNKNKNSNTTTNNNVTFSLFGAYLRVFCVRYYCKMADADAMSAGHLPESCNYLTGRRECYRDIGPFEGQ